MSLCIALTLLLIPAFAEEVTKVDATHNGTFADNLPGNQVVCSPTNWYDIVWFYFANYIMHALSVRSLPGENMFTSVVFKLACLMIPYTGIRRGLCLVARASNLIRHDLQAAARANALCMVIRGDHWSPRNEDEIHGCRIEKMPHNAEPEEVSSPSSSRGTGGENEKEKETDIQIEETKVKKAKTNSFRMPKIMKMQTASTTLSVLSAEEAAASIAFKLSDCYDPAPDTNYLDKLYRWFVETYKFGHSSLRNSIRLDPDYVKIHGLCTLAPGYELVYVPFDIKVSPRSPETPRPPLISSIRRKNLHEVMKSFTSQTRISSSQNAPRILFSIFQVISGAWSLYRAQGVQIERFGYAAYGLTVLPYMIVSMFNFAGSLLTKEYDMVYLVHSAMMDEMVSRGGSVDGVIGTVDPQPDDLAEPAISSAPVGLNALTLNAKELLVPSGSNLQFRSDPSFIPSPHEDVENAEVSDQPSIFYRDPSLSPIWSSALSFAKGVLPIQAPCTSTDAAWRGWAAWKRWYQIKYRNAPPDTPPPGLTIIHIPCHGPLIRLPPPIYEGFLRALTLALLIAALAVPIVVITVLTGWQVKQSENSHRNFVLQWIIAGMVLGYGAGTVENLSGNKTVLKGLVIIFLSYGTYCITGFVTVAQEMTTLGKCTAL